MNKILDYKTGLHHPASVLYLTNSPVAEREQISAARLKNVWWKPENQKSEADFAALKVGGFSNKQVQQLCGCHFSFPVAIIICSGVCMLWDILMKGFVTWNVRKAKYLIYPSENPPATGACVSVQPDMKTTSDASRRMWHQEICTNIFWAGTSKSLAEFKRL